LCPEHFTYKGHTDTIKTIAWLEDDSGFVTTSKDNAVAFWRLFTGTADGQANELEENPIWKYSYKKAVFNAVCVYRKEGSLPTVYTADSDKCVREIE